MEEGGSVRSEMSGKLPFTTMLGPVRGELSTTPELRPVRGDLSTTGRFNCVVHVIS